MRSLALIPAAYAAEAERPLFHNLLNNLAISDLLSSDWSKIFPNKAGASEKAREKRAGKPSAADVQIRSVPAAEEDYVRTINNCPRGHVLTASGCVPEDVLTQSVVAARVGCPSGCTASSIAHLTCDCIEQAGLLEECDAGFQRDLAKPGACARSQAVPPTPVCKEPGARLTDGDVCVREDSQPAVPTCQAGWRLERDLCVRDEILSAKQVCPEGFEIAQGVVRGRSTEDLSLTRMAAFDPADLFDEETSDLRRLDAVDARRRLAVRRSGPASSPTQGLQLHAEQHARCVSTRVSEPVPRCPDDYRLTQNGGTSWLCLKDVFEIPLTECPLGFQPDFSFQGMCRKDITSPPFRECGEGFTLAYNPMDYRPSAFHRRTREDTRREDSRRLGRNDGNLATPELTPGPTELTPTDSTPTVSLSGFAVSDFAVARAKGALPPAQRVSEAETAEDNGNGSESIMRTDLRPVDGAPFRSIENGRLLSARPVRSMRRSPGPSFNAAAPVDAIITTLDEMDVEMDVESDGLTDGETDVDTRDGLTSEISIDGRVVVRSENWLTASEDGMAQCERRVHEPVLPVCREGFDFSVVENACIKILREEAHLTCATPGFVFDGKHCTLVEKEASRLGCPAGQFLRGSVCVSSDLVAGTPKCPNSPTHEYVYQSSVGRCVTADDMAALLECPVGSELVNGRCVDTTGLDATLGCPPEFKLDRVHDLCVREIASAPNLGCLNEPARRSRLVGGTCVSEIETDPHYICPRGLTKGVRMGQTMCLSSEEREMRKTCPFGFVLYMDKCVRQFTVGGSWQCPSGTFQDPMDEAICYTQ